MSLAATLKRARKAVKAAQLNNSSNNNIFHIYQEGDEIPSDLAGSLSVVLKNLEVDSDCKPQKDPCALPSR